MAIAEHIELPGGQRVDARLRDHPMVTDRTVEHGGRGSAPQPFDLLDARRPETGEKKPR